MNPELNSDVSSTENTGEASTQQEKHQSAVTYLYGENRKLQERIEKLEQKEEERERRLSKVEEFIGKVGQAFSSFFRRKGINISEENQGIDEKTTEEGYLDQRPQTDMETYKAQLEAQGLSPQEIVQRMSRFENARSFEGDVNIAPEHQSTSPEGEISFEEYAQYRPSMTDYAKQKIQEAGGVTPEVASEVAATRERVQDSEARIAKSERDEPSGFERATAQAGQTIRQTFQKRGVNLDAENQRSQEEKTTGQLIDEAQAQGTAYGRTAQEILDVSEKMPPANQTQQPEVAPTPA
jgi:hypothetical protein